MKKVRLAACAVALTVGGLTPLGLSPAAADTASTGAAAAYGVNLDLAGTAVVDEAGRADSTLPPGGSSGAEDLVNVPVEPVTIDGVARGVAATSAASTLPSQLDEVTQPVPGPYNARAVGEVADLSVLVEADVDLTTLELATLSADLVRSEAVGVCRSGQAVYSANSEAVNLEFNDEPLGLNAPITDLLDAVNEVLEPLNQLVDFERNVITPTANGIAVDALRLTVLGAIQGVPIAGAEPLVDLRIGHAEVGGLQCPRAPQCSDTQDNDGDGLIDAQDPGCINNGVYDPNDDDETNQLPRTAADTDALPRTGGDASTTVPLAGGLALLALGALALRRRSQASS